MSDEHRPVARSTDPGTSWAAADSVTSETITRTKKAILRLLAITPMTDEEIAERINPQDFTTPSGLRTRRRELVDEGFVSDTGKKVRLESGRFAIVWGIAGPPPPGPALIPVPDAPPAVPIARCPDCNNTLALKKPPLWGYATGKCFLHGEKTVKVG